MLKLAQAIKANAAPIGLALAAAVAMAAAGRPLWKIGLVSGLTGTSTWLLVNASFTEKEIEGPPAPVAGTSEATESPATV